MAYSVHVMHMCQAFAAAGAKVELFVPNRQGEPTEDDFTFYDVQPNFTLTKLPFYGEPTNTLYNITAARRAIRSGAELIYCRSLKAAIFCARHAPTVFEAHVSHANSWSKRQAIKALIRRKHFRRIVTISQALKDDFLTHFPLHDDQVIVAHDGADPLTSNAHEAASEKLHVAYVGQLYPGKGMEIISQLAPLCPFAEFHIIGGREEDIALWKSRTMGTDNLHFHGYRPHAQALAALPEYNVLLAPYMPHVRVKGGTDIGQWMSPLKLFEYMAAGRAILCSDLPVLREVMTHEQNCLLAPPDDIPAWHAALDKLQNGQLRETLGRQAQEAFLAQYTWQQRARNLLANLAEN